MYRHQEARKREKRHRSALPFSPLEFLWLIFRYQLPFVLPPDFFHIDVRQRHVFDVSLLSRTRRAGWPSTRNRIERAKNIFQIRKQEQPDFLAGRCCSESRERERERGTSSGGRSTTAYARQCLGRGEKKKQKKYRRPCLVVEANDLSKRE